MCLSFLCIISVTVSDATHTDKNTQVILGINRKTEVCMEHFPHWILSCWHGLPISDLLQNKMSWFLLLTFSRKYIANNAHILHNRGNSPSLKSAIEISPERLCNTLNKNKNKFKKDMAV